jgi:hypothetical protein
MPATLSRGAPQPVAGTSTATLILLFCGGTHRGVVSFGWEPNRSTCVMHSCYMAICCQAEQQA